MAMTQEYRESMRRPEPEEGWPAQFERTVAPRWFKRMGFSVVPGKRKATGKSVPDLWVVDEKSELIVECKHISPQEDVNAVSTHASSVTDHHYVRKLWDINEEGFNQHKSLVEREGKPFILAIRDWRTVAGISREFEVLFGNRAPFVTLSGPDKGKSGEMNLWGYPGLFEAMSTSIESHRQYGHVSGVLYAGDGDRDNPYFVPNPYALWPVPFGAYRYLTFTQYAHFRLDGAGRFIINKPWLASRFQGKTVYNPPC